MAYATNELVTTASRGATVKQIVPHADGAKPKTFAAIDNGGAGPVTYPVGMPLATLGSGKVTRYIGASVGGNDEVQKVVLVDGIATETFYLVFEGQRTTDIAYNASAATVKTALEALSNIAPGDVDVTLTGTLPTGELSITFNATLGKSPRQLIDVGTVTGLTGGDPYAFKSTAGVSPSTPGISGFVYPNPVTVKDSDDADEDVIGVVLIQGLIHRDQVNTAEIRTLTSLSEANIDAALRASTPSLRQQGLIIDGLSLVP